MMTILGLINFENTGTKEGLVDSFSVEYTKTKAELVDTFSEGNTRTKGGPVDSFCEENTRTKGGLPEVQSHRERMVKGSEFALEFYNAANGVGFELVEPVCSRNFRFTIRGHYYAHCHHANFKARPKGSCLGSFCETILFCIKERTVTACTIVDPDDTGDATDHVCKCVRSCRVCKVCGSVTRHPSSGFQVGGI